MAIANKIKKIHGNMPAVYNTEVNPNWKAFIEAVGSSDQETADLIENVRKQFFVKTASRPYIDRLGTANNVQRPRFVGMDDITFREFIPIMSYHPKQVKLILDKLLDLFFFKESTTSFIQTSAYEPFSLVDGWSLEYKVDSYKQDKIIFLSSDFVDISNATTSEIVSVINRQTKYSYAIPYEDSITKRTYIRVFTSTIGSKGSLEMVGGLANISMMFDGFNSNAGNGSNTQWDVGIVGDTVTFMYTAGDDPGLSSVSVDDIVLIDIDRNRGSFSLIDVDLSRQTFSFNGLFNTIGTFIQTSSNDIKFLNKHSSHVFKQNRRALTWEVKPGEIIVEIPPSPPVVKRKRKGAAHINGIVSLINSIPSSSSINLVVADDFPEDGGKFLIERLEEIQTDMGSYQTSHKFNGRLISDQPVYSYTSKTGSILTGITPSLPAVASLNRFDLASTVRTSNELTVDTPLPNDVVVGEYVIVSGTSGTDGTWLVTSITSSTVLVCTSPGTDASSIGGNIRIERIGLSNSNSKVVLRSSVLRPKMPGPYMWKTDADFVLSAFTTRLISKINAGTTNRNILVEINDIPDNEGRLVFDFGTEKQEGPVRYFYKPSDRSIAIDPAYVFNFTHNVGSSVTKINKRGGIQFKGDGTERSAYITDPSAAREVLEELMQEVKSVGMFLNFLVRFPTQYYATIDTYRSGIDPG